MLSSATLLAEDNLPYNARFVSNKQSFTFRDKLSSQNRALENYNTFIQEKWISEEDPQSLTILQHSYHSQ